MKTGKKFIVLIVLVFVFLPVFAHAVSWWPLVPCGLNEPTAQEVAAGKIKLDPSYYQPCNQCDLLKLLKNIIDFVLIGLMPPAAAILFVWGGFLILMGGANPGLISKGKSIFWNTAIGVAIISASWLITNTIIRSIAADNVAPEWWKFECRVTVAVSPSPTPTGTITPTPTGTATPTPTGTATPTPTPTGTVTPTPTGTVTPTPTGTVTPTPTKTPTPTPTPTGNLCLQPAQLAASNNVPYPRKNAPELVGLISCIQSRLPGQNLGSQYTFDNSYELCNYTRGQRTCTTSCSHAVNSCHYGGRTGSQGALAVDFGNELIGANIIQAAIACGVPSEKARCENAAGVNVGCASGSGANHVHISAASCDAN